MSSHHVVVSTTGMKLLVCRQWKQKQNGTREREKIRTGCCKLRVHPFCHDSLQPQTHAQERYAQERQRVVPNHIAPIIRNARLTAAPDGECRGHGEQRLQECAEHEP